MPSYVLSERCEWQVRLPEVGCLTSETNQSKASEVFDLELARVHQAHADDKKMREARPDTLSW